MSLLIDSPVKHMYTSGSWNSGRNSTSANVFFSEKEGTAAKNVYRKNTTVNNAKMRCTIQKPGGPTTGAPATSIMASLSVLN